MTFSDMFLSLSQEEIDKYFEIFRKALSGSLGKNLHSLDYTLDQELSGEGHKRLMQLKATGLKDENCFRGVLQISSRDISFWRKLL